MNAIKGMDWKDFEVSNQAEKRFFMLERISNDTIESFENVKLDRWLSQKREIAEEDSLILDFADWDAVLLSEDRGKSWEVLTLTGLSSFDRDNVRHRVFQFDWIDSRKLPDNILVTGEQRFEYHTHFREYPGIFKVHIGVRKHDSLWHQLRNKEQKDILEWVKEYNRKLEKRRTAYIFQEEAQKAENKEVCQLENGVYARYSANQYDCEKKIVSPTLKLYDGHFTYCNTFKSQENGVGTYSLRGTYHQIDSLIQIRIIEDSFPDRKGVWIENSNLQSGSYHFTCYDGFIRIFNYKNYFQAVDIKLKKMK